jgi:predicted nucleotidyltransferase
MAKTGTSFFVMLLFGSYAKGRQTKTSDIDLMFITNEKDFERKITDIISLLPLKTHILVFTEEEFIRMKDAKKPNVIKEAIDNSIILYGIEEYHRMKNA